MIGIYKLRTPSNKIYIGQSWDIKKRLNKHRRSIGKEKFKLYCSLQNYRWDDIEVTIEIELSNDIEQWMLDWWEEFFYKKYVFQNYEMLNIRYPGSRGKHSKETKEKIRLINTGRFTGVNNPCYGKKFTEDQLKRLSDSHKGINAGIKHPNHKSVTQYNTRGELVKVWDIVKDAAESVNVTHSAILFSCKTPSSIIGGFYWRYTNHTNTIKNIEIIPNGNSKKHTAIDQFDLNGNFIKSWKSMTEAGNYLNISIPHICSVCKNNRVSAGGFVWRYKK